MLYKLRLLGACALVVAAALSGCSHSQKKDDSANPQADAQVSQAPSGPSDASANAGTTLNAPANPPEQVVSQSTQNQPQLAGQMGQPNVTQSQANVPVQVTTTRTVIIQKQIPTIQINQEKADINRMSADNFVALGFTQDAAQKIVAVRATRPGGFASPADLAQIPGVDPHLVDQLTPNLGVSNDNAATQQAGEAAPGGAPAPAAPGQASPPPAPAQ